jgi:hypothetical protein
MHMNEKRYVGYIRRMLKHNTFEAIIEVGKNKTQLIVFQILGVYIVDKNKEKKFGNSEQAVAEHFVKKAIHIITPKNKKLGLGQFFCSVYSTRTDHEITFIGTLMIQEIKEYFRNEGGKGGTSKN